MKRLGPGVIVAAAFVGPGTVTACTLAGANFGFALIWALVFATVSTIVLQDMAARLGVAARLGLGEAILASVPSGAAKWSVAILVFVALGVGNAAYEAGNLSGGALGLSALIPGNGHASHRMAVALLAVLAAILLWTGRYKLIERVLIGLVLLMSIAFAVSAVLVRPDLAALLGGLRPTVPDGAWLTTIALIGTTIVPYNLFLHAAAARERWSSSGAAAFRDARVDTGVSIGLGGLVSILILATAASSLFGSDIAISRASDMAEGLRPSFGALATYTVGAGLFAAGLTSAITAPLATAYALSELLRGLGLVPNAKNQKGLFRLISLTILAVGTAVALLGLQPVTLILVAQAANGLLLPVVAVFLLVVMNRKSIMGDRVNGVLANVFGWSVVMITFGLGARGIARSLGLWP